MEALNKKEQTKEKIKLAAMQCFKQYGLEKTTLDDIAKKVGLNKATFYYYYKNKEAIFLEVAVHEGQLFLEQLQQKTLAKKELSQQIIFYLVERIRYYRDVLLVNKVSTVTLTHILPQFFIMMEQIQKAEEQFLTSLLQKAIKEKQLTGVKAAAASLALLTMSDGIKHKAEQDALIQQKDSADYEAAIQSLQILLQLILKK
jgi:AcrR family transcriptional regulator